MPIFSLNTYFGLTKPGVTNPRRVRALFVLAAALLCSCASQVPRLSTNAPALEQIRTLSIIRAPEPRSYAVSYPGTGLGVALGLIGWLIVSGDQAGKQSQITQMLKDGGAAPVTDLIENIRAMLVEAGYSVRLEDGPWEADSDRMTLPFDKIRSDADAVLVVAPTIVGFIATGDHTEYNPTITAVVTLLGKNRTEPIYRGFHAAGWEPRAKGWSWSPALRWFPDFQALTNDPRAVAESLHEVAVVVAKSIASDLQR